MRLLGIPLLAGLVLGFASAANAATITIAGNVHDESAFADSVTLWSGGLQTFDVGGASVTDENLAIGGGISDGVRCSTDGCSFLVNFDGGIVNEDGADIAIYTLGVNGTELFDVAVPGGRLSDLTADGTGEFFERFEIGLLLIDLTDMGVAMGDAVEKLKIIVNQGGFVEEFALIASLNSIDEDVLVNPIPAAAWLFGSALVAGGYFSRKRKKNN